MSETSKSELFLNRFLAHVTQMVDSGRTKMKNHSELANAAFTNRGDPVRKWRSIRGNEIGLTLADAFNIAEALGIDLSYLVHMAESDAHLWGDGAHGYIMVSEDTQTIGKAAGKTKAYGQKKKD